MGITNFVGGGFKLNFRDVRLVFYIRRGWGADGIKA